MFLGRDLDDILTYKTPKLVKIRDRKLCLGRMAVIVGVFVYVVIFAVIIQQGYLLRESPVGFSRMSVRSDNAAMTGGYCGAQSSGSGLNYKTLPCLPWSYRESVFPAAEEDSILLTSRATITTTTSTVANQDCYWNINACGSTVSNTTNYFVPGLDAYTVLMAHTVYGVQNNVHYIEREMKEGIIETTDGKKLLDLTKERKNGNNDLPGDLLTVQQILNFAGVDLDTESSSSAGETTRYSGVIILCYIKYRSSKISLSDLKYKMRFVRIPGAEDKHEQTLYRQVTTAAGPVTQRTVINRHGVRVIIAQAGQVGKFSFQELLKTLVTAFALLSVANFFVDKILLRLLPLRSVYEAYKYTMSVDFSELKKDKVNKCYIADAKKAARGRPYPLEAHDFVYGTLLRGGKTGRPEWDIGQGPEMAYRNYVMGEDGNPNLHGPRHSAKYPGMPSSNSIYAYPSPPHMAMGTPNPSPHNNQQLYTPIQMPSTALLPQNNEAIHIAGMPYPQLYNNTTVPEPAPLFPHQRPM